MLAQYLLPCSQCENKIPVGSRHAGGQVNCDQCGSLLDVPKLGQLKQLESTQTQTTAALPVEQNRLKGLLFSGGLILAVLAGLAGGGLFYAGTQRTVAVDVESEIQKQLAQFDQLSEVELYREWKQRPLELGDWQEYDFVRLNREGDVLKFFSYVLMGIAGIGLLLVGGSFLVGSQASPGTS